MPALTYDFLKDACARQTAFLKWKLFGTGPLASMDYSSTAFVRSTDPRCVSPRGPITLVALIPSVAMVDGVLCTGCRSTPTGNPARP